MTKILNDGKRIIFDGHAETQEQCELITLVCNELAKSDKFNTIQYNNAYAEFEKIGNTTDLKFAPASITIVFDSNINSVSATLHNSTVTWSTSGASNMGAAIDGSYYVFNVDLKDGYVLDTVVLSDADSQAGVLDSKTDNSFTILAGIGGINQTITLTSKEAQSKKSIDLTTLSGWGALSDGDHTITVVAKADGYRDSEPSAGVTVTKALI